MRKIRVVINKIILFFTFILSSRVTFCQQEAAAPAQPLFASELGSAKKVIDLLMEFCVKYSFQVLGGIVILILGWFVAKFVANILKKFLEKHKVDITVAKFLITIVKSKTYNYCLCSSYCLR